MRVKSPQVELFLTYATEKLETAWILTAQADARDAVRVSFSGAGDLTGDRKYLDVYLDGAQIGRVFKNNNGGNDGVTVSAAYWNSAAANGNVRLKVIGSDGVAQNTTVSASISYASQALGTMICPGRPGFVQRDGDCDDSTQLVRPGANEICDFKDNNCEGHIDEDTRGGSVCGSQDPSVQQLADITVGTDQCQGTAVTLPTPAVSDDNDPNPTLANNAPQVFPVGRTTVLWRAVDRDGNVGTMGHVVTVNFTGLPTLNVPVNITMEAASPGGTVVNLGRATASICIPGAVTVTNNAPPSYRVGVHTVTWTASHPRAPSATGAQTITITDTTAPTVNAGRDLVFRFPDPVVLTAPSVSDNGSFNRDINCRNNGPETYLDNRWTTVTWSCTDEASNTGSDELRIFRQVGDTPPPTITMLSPTQSGWHTQPLAYNALIDDPACTETPTLLFQGAGLSPTLTRIQENQWQFQTGSVAENGYNTSLIVTSACGLNLTASHSIAFGYDGTRPTATFVGPSQRGVDPNDINTWPGIADRALLNTLVRGIDAGSGIVRVNTTIEPRGGQAIQLADWRGDLIQSRPRRGSRLVTLFQCTNDTHCTRDYKLKLDTLVGTTFILKIYVHDYAGNVSTTETRFRVYNFRASIVAWRDAVLVARSDVPQAQIALNDAAVLLAQALQGYDLDLWGNLVLALEDAVAKINVARGWDSRVSEFNTPKLLTSRLGIDFFDAVYSESRAQWLTPNSLDIYNEASRRLSAARIAQDQGDAGAVFLSLANVYFFTVDGENPRRAEDYVAALTLLVNMTPQVRAYVDLDPTLPARTRLIATIVDLDWVDGYLNRVVDFGGLSLSDREHMELLLRMTATAEGMKESENEGAWVRNWQWVLTHITYIYARRALSNAATFLSDAHPLIVLGSQQLEAARILREQRKPDDFMRIVIDSRCLTAGIYNLVYDPDIDIIEACCAPMRIYHDIDNNVPLPDHCIE
jgi:hypothetical protein